MKQIKLQSPVLRTKELSYTEFAYPILSKKYLPEPAFTNSTTFLDVINNRVSRRTFNKLSFDKLNALLWYSARAIDVAPPEVSPRWQHRPSPSGGGRHPVDIFILNDENGEYTLSLYQPISHSLSLLRSSKSHIANLINTIETVLPIGNATIIWLAAQFDRTLSRYENGESLIWKDVGALTGVTTLVAEYLEINCCPIGINGDPYISEAINGELRITGVGGLLVGEK